MLHRIALDALLWLGVIIALIGALGTWLMRDAWQRLHFLALPCGLSTGLISVAVFIDERQKAASCKVLLIGLLLFAVNAVLTHATARAAFVREHGEWPPRELPRHWRAR
jgi:monovalent cation/proton antiporter MnhG/PhaG subunit